MSGGGRPEDARRARRRRTLRRAPAFLAVLWIAASGLGCLSLNRLMFHPPDGPYPADMAHLVEIGPPDARVAALWYPKDGTQRAVLYSHGNAEDLAACHGRLLRFRDLGYAALAYDYPGYGRSAGSPSEDSVYAAAETAYRHLVDDLGFAPSNVVVVGYSIGSGPSCRLAEDHPVGGLALFAPFKSAVRVVTQVRILPFDAFPNLSRIGGVRCPVLVAHGTDDDVVPFSHGRALAEEAGESCVFVPVEGADHLDLQRRFFSDAAHCDAFLRAFPPAAPSSGEEVVR